MNNICQNTYKTLYVEHCHIQNLNRFYFQFNESSFMIIVYDLIHLYSHISFDLKYINLILNLLNPVI